MAVVNDSPLSHHDLKLDLDYKPNSDSLVNGIMPAPKYIYVLTDENVISHSKKDFADVIKGTDLEMERVSWISRWVCAQEEGRVGKA